MGISDRGNGGDDCAKTDGVDDDGDHGNGHESENARDHENGENAHALHHLQNENGNAHGYGNGSGSGLRRPSRVQRPLRLRYTVLPDGLTFGEWPDHLPPVGNSPETVPGNEDSQLARHCEPLPGASCMRLGGHFPGPAQFDTPYHRQSG